MKKGDQFPMYRHVLSKRSRLRRVGFRLSLIAAVVGLAAGGLPATPDADAASPQRDRPVVRVLTVGAVNTGGLFDRLVADFERRTGYPVEVSVGGPNIYDQARAGEADIVLTHWGFVELERFVGDGLGKWPTTVLANSLTILVPPDDPAGVGDVNDPVEAFRLIAESESPFVVNDLGETRYVTETLWHAAGRPDKGEWYLDLGLSGRAAIDEAAERGGYTIWGLHPFLQVQNSPQPVDLEAVLFDDSLLQRIIAAVVVEPRLSRNFRGARALERYLAHPATQGDIRRFRHPDFPDRPIFWPAGNQNDNR